MGASLDTPAECSLCSNAYRDPITLTCKHRFCKRCIGDLWSDSPTGPYYCPVWQCNTEYKTLPFERTVARASASAQRARPRFAAGQSSEGEVGNTVGKSSFTSRLLGKRKASTPAPEPPPGCKRAATSGSQEPSSEIPTASPSVQPSGLSAAEPSETEERPASLQSNGDIILSSDSSSSSGSDVTPASFAAPQEVPASPQNEPRSEDVIMLDEAEEVLPLDECDGSSEVNNCDAPVTRGETTPVKDTSVSAIKPVSTTPPNRSAGAPPTGTKRSPLVSHVSWPPPVLTAAAAATTTTSPKRITLSPRPETAATTTTSPKRITLSPRPETAAATGPVPCHYCPSTGRQVAVKTCLVCGASMCTEHLRPHLDSPVFQNHALVPAVEDISPWRCPEHQEMNRIYCRQCAACVCTVCTVIGSHRDHACISIREAERELRANLKEDIQQLQGTEQSLKHRVAELTQRKQATQVVLGEAQAGVRQQYTAMREALEQEEATTLQCVTQEESKVVGGLEDQLGRLRDSLNSIQHGLHTLEGLADAKGDQRVQEQAFLMEYSKTTQMLGDIMGSSVEEPEPPEDVDRARLACLKEWTEKRLDTVVISLPERDPYKLLSAHPSWIPETATDGTIPSLDADTAHPKLLLSEDNRRATYSEAPQAYPEHGARFSSFPQVLASRALERGRWYWEVEGSLGEGRWRVGLCEDGIGRKGQKDGCRLGFNSQSWCLGGERGKVEALHDKVAVPVATERLERVGVFLDFDQGILSFYNVAPGGSLALLYCFRHSFTEPLYPALSVSKTHLAICDLFHTPSGE